MESEKAMYWMTLGVLALATATGFVTEHRGWSDRLVDRSVAVVSQASDVAAHYAEIADLMLGRGENDLASPADAMIDVRTMFRTMFRPRFRPIWPAHDALWYAVRLNWFVCRPSECRCGPWSAPRAPSFCPPGTWSFKFPGSGAAE